MLSLLADIALSVQLSNFKLVQGCGATGGSCGGQVVVEYNPKIDPIICPPLNATQPK